MLVSYFSEHPDLRYSLCLCEKEKDFLKKRKVRSFKAMKDLLGDDKAPENIEQVKDY